jgi:hypothetical protein
MGKCRSCHAPVRWVTMPSGEAMICDASPIDDMIFDESVIASGPQNHGFHLTKTQRLQILRPHWATCPDAQEWRKTRREEIEEAGQGRLL